MPPKLSHDYVQEVFSAAGYTLLSKYNRANEKLDFICPTGHRHAISWLQFYSGRRCAYCSRRKVRHEDVELAFSREGYTLLGQYKNCNKKLDFICPKGHRHKTSWDAFKQGARCAVCQGNVVLQKDVEETFRKRGYILLSPYLDRKTNLDFICPQGHIHSISWTSFKAGRGCAICAGKIVTHEEVEEAFKKRGYTLLDRYQKNTSRLKFICPEGHQHSITWSQFRFGSGCARCAGQWKTDEEREITKIQDRLHQQFTYAIWYYDLNMKPKKHVLAKKIAQSLIKQIGRPSEGQHIDHIVPQSFFDLRNEDEVLACWSICNLRYIAATENSRRRNKLTTKEALQFTREQFEVLMMASRKPLSWQKWVDQRKQVM